MAAAIAREQASASTISAQWITVQGMPFARLGNHLKTFGKGLVYDNCGPAADFTLRSWLGEQVAHDRFLRRCGSHGPPNIIRPSVPCVRSRVGTEPASWKDRSGEARPPSQLHSRALRCQDAPAPEPRGARPAPLLVPDRRPGLLCSRNHPPPDRRAALGHSGLSE